MSGKAKADDVGTVNYQFKLMRKCVFAGALIVGAVILGLSFFQ